MLLLKMWRGTVKRESLDAFGRVTANVPKEFKPVVESSRTLHSSIFGLPTEVLEPPEKTPLVERTPLRGEIFTDGVVLCVLSVWDRTSQQRAKASPDNELRVDFDYVGPVARVDIADNLAKEISHVFTTELQQYYYASKQFDELKAEGKESPPRPTDAELQGVSTLRDKPTRTVLASIKASGGLLLRDLPKQLPAELRNRTEEIRSSLLSCGLIQSEIVVICGKSQSQTARAPSREFVTRLSQEGLKCACGRAIAEERIEEALTITDGGRTLLDKSRWLTILLVQELERVGVPIDHILIEQQLGGDEIDCVANISGELVLFELKDKEFNLGSAYSFGAKIGILRPSYAVIVTTENVGNDAKEHFQRASHARKTRGTPYFDVDWQVQEKSPDINYIEGVDNLGASLGTLVGNIYQSDAIRIVNQVFPMAFPDPKRLIEALDK